MKPIHHKHTNKILGAPAGWDAQRDGPCEGLPICHVGTETPINHSYWKLSLRERLSLLVGAKVHLSVIGNGHPPVALGTQWISEIR